MRESDRSSRLERDAERYGHPLRPTSTDGLRDLKVAVPDPKEPPIVS
ncbi:hypothetical protein SAMN04487983_102815 [Streptomyces sp. yr375]|nr:hypothetical protein SAMN04487983_102815 [Streptomyces sp. yr375]